MISRKYTMDGQRRGPKNALEEKPGEGQENENKSEMEKGEDLEDDRRK